MKLEGLIDIAFQRGCGISLHAAQTHARYAELKDLLQTHSHPSQAAAVQYLGETLIDTAMYCLPQDVLDLADQWQGCSAEARLVMLEYVYQRFRAGSQSPQYNPRPRQSSRQHPGESLPAEYGPWDFARHRPCCMGFVILLMAFAKRAGALHYLAQVLRSIDKELLRQRLMVSDLTLKFANQVDVAFLAERQRAWQELIAQELQKHYNFHPCLVIAVDDSRYVQQDPYLGTRGLMHLPPAIQERLESYLTPSSPHHIAILTDAQALTERFSHWADHLSILVRIAENLRELRVEDPVAAAFTIEDSLNTFRAELPELDGIWHLFWHDKLLERAYVQDDDVKLSQAEFDEFTRRLETDDGFRRRTLEELIAYPVRTLITLLQDVWVEQKAVLPHPTIELANPANGVAVGVLGNLVRWLKPKVIQLDQPLVYYSDSQTVWHNTQVGLRHRKQLDPSLRQALKVREEALRRTTSAEYRHPYVHNLLKHLTTTRLQETP